MRDCPLLSGIEAWHEIDVLTQQNPKAPLPKRSLGSLEDTKRLLQVLAILRGYTLGAAGNVQKRSSHM